MNIHIIFPYKKKRCRDFFSHIALSCPSQVPVQDQDPEKSEAEAGLQIRDQRLGLAVLRATHGDEFQGGRGVKPGAP